MASKKEERSARNKARKGAQIRQHKPVPMAKRREARAVREAVPYSIEAVEISDWITVFMPNGEEAAYCGLTPIEQATLRKALREGTAERGKGVIYADEVHFDL